jgi:hypothetical protein
MIPRLSPAGLFLALLAVAMQLALGAAGGSGRAAPIPDAARGAELALLSALLPGASILCHADTDAPSPIPQPREHGDCAICPLCAAIAHPAALPATPAILPSLLLAIPLAAPPPPATAPPAIDRTSAQPRAPPALT